MISFIPKGKEGNAKAGVRAGGQALLVVLVSIPYYYYCKARDCWRDWRRNV